MGAQLGEGGIGRLRFVFRKGLGQQGGPGAESLVVTAHPLKTSRDVELHVAVGHQAVRLVPGRQGVFVVLVLVGAVAAQEVELGLVGLFRGGSRGHAGRRAQPKGAEDEREGAVHGGGG